MSLKDLLNKGVNYISKSTNAAIDAAKEKKSMVDNYRILTDQSKHLDEFKPYEIKNTNPSLSREQMILSLCLTINVENAKIINNLIPLEEIILDTKRATETKTQMDYFFVITDRKLWILNKNEYKTYEFGTIAIFEIINKSILSQGVNFDNNAFSFEGNEEDVKRFGLILMNVDTRNMAIEDYKKYSCGVISKYELVNHNFRGITIGINDEIVLHNGMELSKLIKAEDIEYVQLLIDNSVVMTRGKTTQSQVSSLNPCRKMSLKFVLPNEIFNIDIMPESTMGLLVKVEDTKYQDSLELSKKIIQTIETMIKK